MPPSLPPDIAAALGEVADRLATAEVTWLASGSVARALTGFATTPRDLDIEVAAADADRAARALGLSAAWDTDPGARSLRAVGHLGAAEIDVIGALAITGPRGTLPPDFPLMLRFATRVPVDGRLIPVAPIEEQMLRITISGDEARRARFVAETPDGFVARDDYFALRSLTASAAR